MRSITATIIAAGLWAQSLAVDPAKCLKSEVYDSTDRCYTSQLDLLESCIGTYAVEATQNHLQACFIRAGCDSLDAEFEAQWIMETCFGESQVELKIRADDEEDATTTKETTTSTKKDETTTSEDDTTTTTSEETTTTAEAATTVQTTTVSATDTDTVTSDSSSTTLSATALAASESATTSLVCFTTITFTTEGYESVTDSDGSVTRSYNTNKVGTKTKCADGMTCSGSACMVAQNGLESSGVAVAIFFGSAAAVSMATLIFLCCRDRRNDKRLRAKAEAAKIAKEAAASAKPSHAVGAGMRSVSAGRRSPSGNDRQPLMNQGMYPPSPGGSNRPSHDPFGDQRRV